jgi:hypothetical protein
MKIRKRDAAGRNRKHFFTKKKNYFLQGETFFSVWGPMLLQATSKALKIIYMPIIYRYFDCTKKVKKNETILICGA